ncbi:hypothetical protein N7519_001150 [Penicillium mononematosum]|uniref:uncharacterized protein n=1 Tax=Penicillium mononematosum TaxID=268346 RepID=UPI002548315B|nr:uncharacterized protein N7519_001150 [Penicillium mononematosum]KAJ6191129.1 hypothetical protein N7519_001150 [Penicillium mononematosum]
MKPSAAAAGSRLLRNFLYFLAFFSLLAFYSRTISSRDPGSVFFKPWTAYDASYSSVRAHEADSYIESVNNATVRSTPKASSQPGLCVGIASIARNGVRYFKTAVGTVLEGLSEEERADIHLILFIAHTDPSQHPAYSEPWLHKLPDQVLLYDPAEVDIDHIRSLETDTAKVSGREKALFDYTYLLKACEAVNTPYTVMLEDDVFALDGWYHRTLKALASAEKQTKEIGASNWLYLRLFYTEELLGWNSEEWPTYLFYSILTVLLVACTCLGVRRYEPRLASHLSNETILLLSGVCAPLLIGLFFATGRATMMPIPDGVHQMPQFGCCSQAFVFPRSRIPDLTELYERKRLGYVDMLTEEFANENGEIRWAVTPVVMQHAGRRSSKGMNNDPYTPLKHKNKAELTEVEKLWNFRFETQDAETLREEHVLVNDHVLGY